MILKEEPINYKKKKLKMGFEPVFFPVPTKEQQDKMVEDIKKDIDDTLKLK